jgi:hypothetical protein
MKIIAMVEEVVVESETMKIIVMVEEVVVAK